MSYRQDLRRTEWQIKGGGSWSVRLLHDDCLRQLSRQGHVAAKTVVVQHHSPANARAGASMRSTKFTGLGSSVSTHTTTAVSEPTTRASTLNTQTH
ncbi:hypothetical protein ETAA8_50080 [Anatilimnocola aggregata]|uniref:Uncharacterized protein n=1 Tax=Anatilimnocola aggregata TaxID=2528021 RepID=A0A517YI50_9BACT|nr:hypothetical protein ETAA8_50080 [Anatilimnocola aggregata]